MGYTDKEQREIFAQNLLHQIRLSQKTQKQVAKELGISPTTLNNWIKCVSMPKVSIIQKLADYFMINKSDLVDDKENDPKYKYSTDNIDYLLRVNTDKGLMEFIIEYYKVAPSDREKALKMAMTYINMTKGEK